MIIARTVAYAELGNPLADSWAGSDTWDCAWPKFPLTSMIIATNARARKLLPILTH